MLYVKDIMNGKVKTIEDSSSLTEAAASMAKSKIGSLVVLAGSAPVGIITEGDISRAVAKKVDVGKTPVRSVISKHLVTCKREMKVEEAARLMASSNVKKLPVVEEGKLVGIVTQSDIVASSFSLVTSLKEMVNARYRPRDFEP